MDAKRAVVDMPLEAVRCSYDEGVGVLTLDFSAHMAAPCPEGSAEVVSLPMTFRFHLPHALAVSLMQQLHSLSLDTAGAAPKKLQLN